MDFPLSQAQFELAGLGIFPDVGHGLGDPEQGEALLFRAMDVVVGRFERDGVFAAQIAGHRTQGFHEAKPWSSGGRRSSMMRRFRVMPEPMVSMRRRKRVWISGLMSCQAAQQPVCIHLGCGQERPQLVVHLRARRAFSASRASVR